MRMSTTVQAKAMTTAARPILALVATGKSYTQAQNERVRARARDLLLAKYGNNKTSMAAALGVSQPTLSNFLNGKNGAGHTLASAVARELGTTHDALVQGHHDVSTAGSLIRFGDLDGWSRAEAEAMTGPTFRGRLPDAAYFGAREFRGVTAPSVIDARTVYNYAKAYWEGLSDDAQSQAIHDQAEREMADEDAEATELLSRGKLRDELQEIRARRGH